MRTKTRTAPAMTHPSARSTRLRLPWWLVAAALFLPGCPSGGDDADVADHGGDDAGDAGPEAHDVAPDGEDAAAEADDALPDDGDGDAATDGDT